MKNDQQLEHFNTIVQVSQMTPEQQKERIYHLFHKLWTKAVGQQEYIKDEWKELTILLSQFKIHV